MKSLSSILFVILLALSVPSPAQDNPDETTTGRFVLAKVRLLPKSGSAGLLAGARVTGSNEGPTTAFVELARIDFAPPSDGWLEITIPSGKVYRYVKIESAKGTGLALAEVEFRSTSGLLIGNGFGTSLGDKKSTATFDKALDHDPKTFFESPAENSYVGIDLGSQAQAPAPHFNPAGGVFAATQKVAIGTWPSGATIRYTTDGSSPSASSQVYRQPIVISDATSIAAIASRPGLADSDVAIATYRIGAAATAQKQVKSYHLGNSLTDTVNGFLQPIADSGGRNLLFMRKTVPGCSIRFHWDHNRAGFASPDAWAADYNVACAKQVDHLFLQPFSNPPGLDDDGTYGGKFIELARKFNPAAEAWLYAQWPAWSTWKFDAHCVGAGWMKPPWFPPNRKPADWEEAMANKMHYYRDLKKIWDEQIQARGGKPVRVCPGGPALVRLKKEIESGKVPDMTDFHDAVFSDDIHLTRQGRYLVALVHYACIFAANPQGKVTYANSGLSKQQAAIFQRVAWETVLAEPASGVRK